MELKEAMEAATSDLDVRPGFVGDVMAGARRRHTRKLLSMTAALALVAGLVTGVVLTRHPTDVQSAGDVRLTTATRGDLASHTDFLDQVLVAWNNKQPDVAVVTEVSPDAHVFWAANTPDGPASLVVQSVRVRDSSAPQTLVGLVHGVDVVDQEVAYQGGRETGIYRIGRGETTYVVLGLGKRIFWSAEPVRGPDLRYSRNWQEAALADGVAVVTAKPAEHPVFLRTTSTPAPDDFSRVEERISPRAETEQRKTTPSPGLGWNKVMWASSRREPDGPGPSQDKSVPDDLRRLGYLDYDSPYLPWEIRAWLPDGRFAAVIETGEELLCGLYQPDGKLLQVLPGAPAAKGTQIPVRLTLPDGQGTILADRGARMGPMEQEDAWLAPPGTTEVTLWRNGNSAVVPL